MVCIPFFLDQFAHCKTLAKKLKMGIILEPRNIKKQTFSDSITEVLTNQIYTTNARNVQSLLLDQPQKSKDLFLYWINYTIRHKGTRHLISDVPFELNVFQYMSLDVIIFLILVTIIPLLLLVLIVRAACLNRNDLREKKLN